MAAGANATKVRVIACGADAVAQEDVEHVVLRVYPKACACEARVTVGLGSRFGAGVASVRVTHDGLIKS